MFILRRNFSEVEQREFGKHNNRKNEPTLRDTKSHRGLGRAYILGGGGGAIGGYSAKQKANDLYDEGHSDNYIVDKATSHGAKVGGLSGAALGAGAGIAVSKLPGMRATGLGRYVTATGAIGGGVYGAIGGGLGANKNTKTRIKKLKMKKAGIED